MARANLHDALAKQSFDHAVICTFSFQARFFEDYCLEHFKSLDNNNVTVILDRCVYDELVAQPPSDWPKLANLRYLLHPIDAPRIFHPKLFLLASKDKGLLIVGSANFTKPGLTANAEMVGIYRYERGKREGHLGVFRQAVDFLIALARRFPGEELESNLNELTADASWLNSNGTVMPSRLRLLHNLDSALWPQIASGIKAPVDALHILSRYFESEPDLLTRVRGDLKPRRTVLWTQSGYTTMTPKWFEHPAIKQRSALVRDISIQDEGHPQPLHAKAIAIVEGKTVRLAFGSANFSTSGLLSTASTGNVELMLVADGVLSTCNPERLFDPSSTSEVLKNSTDLKTAEREPRLKRTATSIVLTAAGVSDGRLVVALDRDNNLPLTGVVAVLSYADRGESRIALRAEGAVMVATLDAAIDRLCGTETTVIRVEVPVQGEKPRVSNSLFLVNLRDYETGRGQRRERRVREAQRSAIQFSAMLQELLQVGETDALKTFLTHCDIQVINGTRLSVLRGARGAWSGPDALRALGAKNLREYASLHEAAMGFCERHSKRMARHCDRASLDGIPNFMHMALAISDVMQSQVERLLIGLESVTEPLTPEAWFDHRQRIGQYLRVFEGVVDGMFNRYVPALKRRFTLQAITDALRPDMGPLARLSTTFLGVKERIEACLDRGLRVGTIHSRGLARLNDHDLVSSKRWPEWRTSMLGFSDLARQWGNDTSPGQMNR